MQPAQQVTTTADLSLQRQLFASRRASLAGDMSATQEAIRGVEAQQQGIVSGRESRKLQQESLKEKQALAVTYFVERDRYDPYEIVVTRASRSVVLLFQFSW